MAIFDLENSDIGKKINTAVSGVTRLLVGTSRTDGNYTPIGLIGKKGKRYKPGFTPNELYDETPALFSNPKGGYPPESWYGFMLENHPFFSGDVENTRTKLSTIDRFERSKNLLESSFKGPYTTRDYQIIFGDTSMDYFKYGLHVIDGKNVFKSDGGGEVAWDGSGPSPTRGKYNTPYENSDPVFFGFEIVIDAVSSPLLNGSVEDFIDQFSRISEISSRSHVLKDFKRQFSKFFKTKGTIKTSNLYSNIQPTDQLGISINTPNYATENSQSQRIFEGGRKAYMSYYIKKIQGLENLIISNSPSKKKYLTDYRTDVLKITFNEDVSLSLSTMAQLYQLLYWSKANGKNLIPENLLRFNCDIIISECRNFNRVRKAIDTQDIEVLKENLSRTIYQLRECQLYFDTPTHDSEIDLEGIKEFIGTSVTMDYKYVQTKFERWTPDSDGFGQYVGYNNGALWKIGNKGWKESESNRFQKAGTTQDVSVPKFYTVGTNHIKSNGVASPIVFESYSENKSIKDEPTTTKNIEEKEGLTKDGKLASNNASNEAGDPESGEDRAKAEKKAQRKAKFKEGLEAFKESSLKNGRKLALSLVRATEKELRAQVNIRLKLLNDTLNKIKEAPFHDMSEPRNIYKTPFVGPGIAEPDSFLGNPRSSFFYDVQGSLKNFLGDSMVTLFGGQIGTGDKLTGFLKGFKR